MDQVKTTPKSIYNLVTVSNVQLKWLRVDDICKRVGIKSDPHPAPFPNPPVCMSIDKKKFTTVTLDICTLRSVAYRKLISKKIK